MLCFRDLARKMSIKRPQSEEMREATKKPKHWSLGLLDAMKDIEFIVKETEKAVVIRDKYPKAKIHYLVVAQESINSINDLNKSHLGLLENFKNIYEDLEKLHEGTKLRAGFHAVPSMRRLHMHVISNDMISPCLKTKVHWNSFTTKFFLPLEDVIKELAEKSLINKIDPDYYKNLMASQLKCNQCSFIAKNMPNLKEHLLTHDN